MRKFDEYIKEGIIRNVSSNAERAKDLRKEAARKFAALNEKVEKLGVRDDNANDYVEYCYDLIMALIRAKLFLKGYLSNGQGAHEAEVSYLEKLEFSESDVNFTDKLRYFRNGILYYGKQFDSEYANKVIGFTKKVYLRLSK